LGQTQDYTAICVVERFERSTGTIRYRFGDRSQPVPELEWVYHAVHLE
jgi:hypothetical protein